MRKISFIFAIISLLFIPLLALAIDDLFDYYNTGDDSSDNAYDCAWIGQSFIASENYEITSIKVKIWKLGSPEGEYLNFAIRKAENYQPIGNNLTTGTIAVADLYTGSVGRWDNISLTPYRLEKGQQYAIIMWGDGRNLNDFRWRRDTNSSYILGKRVESSDCGSTWSSTEGVDFMFETYGLEYTPPVIPVDADFVLNALAYVGDVWTDFKLVAIFGMGLPVGFYIVKKVVALF